MKARMTAGLRDPARSAPGVDPIPEGTARAGAVEGSRQGAAASRYRVLFELAGVGIFIADPRGRYVDVNAMGCRMLGYTREELLALSVGDIVSSEDAARVRPELARLRAGEALLSRWHLRRKDGTLFPGDVNATALPDGYLMGVLRDVTAEVERTRVLERVSDAFIALDTEWRCTHVNEKAALIFGRRPEDLVGRQIWTSFPEEVGQPFYEAYQRAMEKQVSIQMEEYYAPYDQWFEIRIYPSPDGLSIFFLDITKRKRFEEELRQSREELRTFADRLLSGRDEDARRISHELHDELGQALTGLKMDVAALARRSSQKEQTDMLAQMASAIDETVRAVRRIATELRPPILEDLGLSAAIEWLVEEFRTRNEVSTEISSTIEEHRLEPNEEIAAFRIVQEALTNVARHAGATRVRVELTSRAGRIIVRVLDDGVGIPDPPGRVGPSLGLVGMRERARALGGTLTIERVEPRGTSVTLEIPVRDTEAVGSNPGGHRTS
jgi:PAS domain S-box-containing protein